MREEVFGVREVGQVTHSRTKIQEPHCLQGQRTSNWKTELLKSLKLLF